MFTKKFNYLYVEPSSHCALQCPLCPRTIHNNNFHPTHLELEKFMEFIQSSLWNELEIIEFGGNLGDPIMHPELHQLIQISKSRFPSAKHIIHTSGAHRSEKWWQDLAMILNKDTDDFLFSIDGTRNTNSTYRINSNWEKIISGVKTCTPIIDTTWKMIVFKHNQHEVMDTLNFAKQLGVKFFFLVLNQLGGDKWLSDFYLKNPHTSNNPQSNVLIPKCQQEARHYLSSDGEYYPCCWTAFQKLSNVNNPLQIDSNNFSDIMNSAELEKIKSSWQKVPIQTCKEKCSGIANSKSEVKTQYTNIILDLSMDSVEVQEKINHFLEYCSR